MIGVVATYDDLLPRLEPLARLSPGAQCKAAALYEVQRLTRSSSFSSSRCDGHFVYLAKGELLLTCKDGMKQVLVGGSEAANRPLGRYPLDFDSAKPITDLDLICFDDESLDLLATWSEMTPAFRAHKQPVADWRNMSGIFSAGHLTGGPLASLPPAHIEPLFERFERMPVLAGQEIVKQGERGDFYYLIEQGQACVTKRIGGADLEVAHLRQGDAFGEEALVADTVRNATVRMDSDGFLLRLAKQDFFELLRQPLLKSISATEAQRLPRDDTVWLDVRFPAEYQAAHVSGAVNIPLSEIRAAFDSLNRSVTYVVCCATGRRSSAAAFLLAQRGFDARWLEGGLFSPQAKTILSLVTRGPGRRA